MSRPREPEIQLRNDRGNLSTRAIQFRALTINEDERSVEGVVTTEAPVEMFDWQRFEVIDEILLADRGDFPDQLPLLASHDRWSLDSVLGSARNFKGTTGSDGQRGTSARLFFAAGDTEVDRIWNKTRQGHLRDLSLGYRVLEATTIETGQTGIVAGRSFTAGKRALRIATRWVPKEVSLTPIGANAAAKTRDGERNMNLRQYLESLGLPSTATDAQAAEFHRQLTGEQRTRADSLVATVQQHQPIAGAAAATGDSAAAPATRTLSPATPPAPAGADPPAAQTPEQLERARVVAILDAGRSDIPRDLVQRAIADGWDLHRANREFLNALRDSRVAAVAVPAGAPAVHVRSHEVDCNARSLAAGQLIAAGLDPTKCRVHNGYRMPAASDVLTAQDADLGDRYRDISAIDLVRQCVRIDTGRVHLDHGDLFRAAMSGATLSYVFTTNVYARLLAGWEFVGDTTIGWCDEEDVANFLTQEDISLQHNARLERLGRGDTAKDATFSDTRETYKIGRYAKKFTVDEQDVIDDRLGAIMRMPEEMGQAARRLRPDLVYSLMLQNPTMTDTGAVFNATAETTAGGHANLGTGALSDANLKVAVTDMGAKRMNNDVLNIVPRYLIVPAALDWQAQMLLTAASLAKLFADTSDPIYTTENMLARKRLVPVMDDRLGATGVIDPTTGATRVGTATNWFLTAGTNRGLRVAYRRGTNRQPQLRSYTLDKGQWGLGWDINMDIGAVFTEYRTWYKSTGAV